MNFNLQKNKFIFSYLFLISIIFIFIKIYLFIDFFPRFDSAFYIKWIIDLNNSLRILPEGNTNIYENLVSDYNSFLHNYFKRIYNNVALLYHLIPIVINYAVGEIFDFHYKTFNFLSIIANCTLAFIFTFIILNKSNLKRYDLLIALLLVYLFFSSFSSLFFLSPLGIHNYSLISLLISFLVLEKFYKKDNFLNFKTLTLGLLLPVFSHHFNILIIFSIFLMIFVLRFKNNHKVYKDLFIILIIFFILSLPILIFNNLHEHNTKLLKIFLFPEITEENISFISKIFLYLFHNIKDFVINFGGHFGIFGSIIFLIVLFKSNNDFLKFLLLTITLIFILFPLTPYLDRLYNYFLLFAIFFVCKEFTNIYKNRTYKLIFVTLFLLTIVNNFLQVSFTNLRSEFNHKLITRFPNNEVWKKRFTDIVDYVGNNKIIFFDYQASDPFYSVFNKVDKIKLIHNVTPVTTLVKRFINEDIDYLRLKKIDQNYFKETYVMFFSLKKDKDNFLNQVCYLQKKFYNECYSLKVIEKFNFVKPLEYQHNGHYFQLILFKSE